MKKTYYGNELIKDLEEIIAIFELYEKSGVLHHQDMMKLKVYLTPPTSDEVCEALSEYFGDDYKVNVSTSNQIFVEHKDDRDGDVCIEYDGELIYFDNFSLPPHLITLIGRFYEGMEKGEVR